MLAASIGLRKADIMERIPPELVGRAVQDPEFRRRLLTDPATAIEGTGYELDQDQIDALTALDAGAVERAVEALVGDGDTKYG